MRDENCIFCKIVAGEIPSRTLFEDEDFKVMLDVGPAAKGHALIVPKAHYTDIYELPGELAGEAMKLAKRMAAQALLPSAFLSASTLPSFNMPASTGCASTSA